MTYSYNSSRKRTSGYCFRFRGDRKKGMRRGVLAPGIFHTKSLTPSAMKVARHQAMIDNGSMITSIDEEGGLLNMAMIDQLRSDIQRKLLNNLLQYLAGVQMMSRV